MNVEVQLKDGYVIHLQNESRDSKKQLLTKLQMVNLRRIFGKEPAGRTGVSNKWKQIGPQSVNREVK